MHHYSCNSLDATIDEKQTWGGGTERNVGNEP